MSTPSAPVTEKRTYAASLELENNERSNSRMDSENRIIAWVFFAAMGILATCYMNSFILPGCGLEGIGEYDKLFLILAVPLSYKIVEKCIQYIKPENRWRTSFLFAISTFATAVLLSYNFTHPQEIIIPTWAFLPGLMPFLIYVAREAKDSFRKRHSSQGENVELLIDYIYRDGYLPAELKPGEALPPKSNEKIQKSQRDLNVILRRLLGLEGEKGLIDDFLNEKEVCSKIFKALQNYGYTDTEIKKAIKDGDFDGKEHLRKIFENLLAPQKIESASPSSSSSTASHTSSSSHAATSLSSTPPSPTAPSVSAFSSTLSGAAGSTSLSSTPPLPAVSLPPSASPPAPTAPFASTLSSTLSSAAAPSASSLSSTPPSPAASLSPSSAPSLTAPSASPPSSTLNSVAAPSTSSSLSSMPPSPAVSLPPSASPPSPTAPSSEPSSTPSSAAASSTSSLSSTPPAASLPPSSATTPIAPTASSSTSSSSVPLGGPSSSSSGSTEKT